MSARFDDLEVFEAIRRTGSLSAASRDLRRSANAVTRSLSRLEESLGVRLFHRTTRAIALTDEGRRFVPHADELRATLERLSGDLDPRATGLSGTLRVTVSATFARFYLAPVVADLREAHPDLRLELLLTDEVVDLVERGLDAGIRIGPLADSSLSVAKLSEDRRMVVAAPSLIERVGAPTRPSDLKRLPCVSLGTRRRWKMRGGEVRIDPVVDASLGDFVLEAAVAALGFAHLATWLAGPSLRAGRLVRVLEPYELPHVGAVAIVTPTRKGRPARVRALLDAARRHLVPAPWTLPEP